MKKGVYLNSTIPSYLFDERESLETYTTITKKWWAEESKDFRVVLSEATVAETSRGNHPHRDRIMQFVAGVELPPMNRSWIKLLRSTLRIT